VSKAALDDQFRLMGCDAFIGLWLKLRPVSYVAEAGADCDGFLRFRREFIMDEISKVVELALAVARKLIFQNPARGAAVVESIRKLREDIERQLPSHPSIAKIDAFCKAPQSKTMNSDLPFSVQDIEFTSANRQAFEELFRSRNTVLH
jgi:hypothetical protein